MDQNILRRIIGIFAIAGSLSILLLSISLMLFAKHSTPEEPAYQASVSVQDAAGESDAQLPDDPFFSDTEHDQGDFWNYIVHTQRSYQMKQFHFIPLILFLSWIPMLIASIVSFYLYCREDTVTKGFTGGVSGEISEVFDPRDAKDLLPRQSFQKEVRLRSTSDIDTRAYIRVEIPVAADKESFVDALTADINTADFQLVSARPGRTAGSVSVYLYRFRRALKPGEETPPLFRTMEAADLSFAEGLEDRVLISGYLIQWDHFQAKDADKHARAWSSLNARAEGVYFDPVQPEAKSDMTTDSPVSEEAEAEPELSVSEISRPELVSAAASIPARSPAEIV